MNKRINELIEECTSVNDDLVYDGSESYMKTTEYFDKEKFAALVAAAARADEREECARKASIALLGANKALTDRVLKAIRVRGTT